MSITTPVIADELDAKESAALADLIQIWNDKRPKNALLSVYYESKQFFKNIGIAVDRDFDRWHGALGWPEKAVQGLARLHVFEGFSLNGHTDPFEINELLDANRFELLLPQALTSAYKHSCSFITTTPGDTEAGEPPVVIQARSAEFTAARWDMVKHQIKYALAITDTDKQANPSQVILFLPNVTITLGANRGVWVVLRRDVNPLGRVMMEPISYDPQLDRPFGRSRITREVRYLTDLAIRTMLRSEIQAEFFSSPQRALIAADKNAFEDPVTWSAKLGRIWAIGMNEEGESPNLQQLSQSSGSMNVEFYRQAAQNFCAATSLPQSSVGLFGDNPQSAQAMEMAWAPLAAEGEYQWRILSPSLKRVSENTLMLRDGRDALPGDAWKQIVNWVPCRYVSPAVAADWAVKAVGADPDLQGTTVVRRRLGLSEGELAEVEAEIRRRGSVSVLDRLGASSEVNDDADNQGADQPVPEGAIGSDAPGAE